MEMLEISIDGKKYEYVDSISYNGKCYVAFSNGGDITISEYVIENDSINLVSLTDEEFETVKDVMNLS